MTEARSHGDFAALCHDLRQFVIAGRLLTDGPEPEDADLRERIELLRANFDHAALMLDGVLRGERETTRVDLARTAAEVVALERHRHDVELAAPAAPEQPVAAVGDPVDVRRAVGWLVRYGAATSGGRGVVVRVGHEAGRPFVETSVGGGPRSLLTDAEQLALLVGAARRCGAQLTLDVGAEAGTSRLVLDAA